MSTTTRLAAVLAVIAALLGMPALAGPAPATASPAREGDTYTSFAAATDPGGQAVANLTEENADFQASGDADSLKFVIAAGDDSWWVHAAAPSGETLAQDVAYAGAGATATGPELFVHGPPETRLPGCDRSVGRFRIHELAYEAGELSALSLTFDLHCSEDLDGVRGSLAWQSSQPALPVPAYDPNDPAPVSGVAVVGGVASADVSWAPPADPGTVGTVVRMKPGVTPPGLKSRHADEVYSGPDHSFRLVGLAPGHDYALSLFAVDYAFHVAEATTVVLHGTRLTATFRRTRSVRRVVGRLVDADGAPLSRFPVTAISARPGKEPGATTRLTNKDGEVEFPWHVVRRPETARLYFNGLGSYIGDGARVRLHPRR